MPINGTNSLVNAIAGASGQPVPVVGMGATRLLWTDRVPCTIIGIHYSRKTKLADKIVVQEDDYHRADKNGMSESQTYLYTPNPDGPIHTYSLRKNGAWVRQGGSSKGGERLWIGKRERYYDFTF